MEERYTDNVRSSPADAQGDFITTLSPSFSLSGQGARLRANVNYSLSYDRYLENSDLDGYRHSLLGVTETEAVQDMVFLDARASVSDQAVSRSGPSGDRTQPTNQTRVATYTLTPRFERRLGGWAATEALWRHAETKYLQTSVGSTAAPPADTVSDAYKLGIKSGDDFSRWRWSLFADASTSQRNVTDTLTQRSLTASSDFAVHRGLGVLTTVGQESIRDPSLDGDEGGGMFYAAGLRWQPSPRTMAKGEVGRRYGTLNWSAEAQYLASAKTSLRAMHREGLKTQALNYAERLNAVQRNESGQLVDPFTGAEAEPNAENASLNNDLFREKENAVTLAYRTERDNLAFTGTLTDREYTADDSTEQLLKLDLAAGHSFTPQLGGNAALSYSKPLEKRNGKGDDVRWQASAGLSYRFNQSLSGNAGYTHQTLESDTGRGYSENVISLGFRKEF